MTDATPTLSHGDEYILLFVGGPNDGQTDSRISTDGSWDTEVTVVTAVDGKETLIEYTATEAKSVGEQVHVTYAYDAADSEPVDAPEDRGGRQ